MVFTQSEEQEVWNLAKADVILASEFELAVISKILKVEQTGKIWAFQKGVHCPRCSHSITILDFFLNGIVHHSRELIEKLTSAEVDTTQPHKVVVADHEISLTCLGCGARFMLVEYATYYYPYASGWLQMSSKSAARYKARLRVAATESSGSASEE